MGERFEKREGPKHSNVFHRRSTGDSYSTRSEAESKVVDFSDVFGGPPRRFQVRSLSEDSAISSSKDNDRRYRSSTKKPFGADFNRVHVEDIRGKGFFVDIFRDGKSYGSPAPPRSGNGAEDRFHSTPRSWVLSPVVPLPPKAEPFDTLLPPRSRSSNLQAKLTKAVDSTVLSSGNRSKNKDRDGTAVDGEVKYSYAQRESPPTSRFSSRHGTDALRKDAAAGAGPSHHRRFSSADELGRPVLESANVSCQFHFSVYKWASRGASLLMPPLRRGENALKFKEKSETYEQCFPSSDDVQRVHDLRKRMDPKEDECSEKQAKLRTQEYCERAPNNGIGGNSSGKQRLHGLHREAGHHTRSKMARSASTKEEIAEDERIWKKELPRFNAGRRSTSLAVT